MVVIWAKLIKLAILLSHEMIHHLSAEKQIRMITISKQGHTRTKKKWKKNEKSKIPTIYKKLQYPHI